VPAGVHALSLHDALPILGELCGFGFSRLSCLCPVRPKPRRMLGGRVLVGTGHARRAGSNVHDLRCASAAMTRPTEVMHYARIPRSEEHTSELQSRENLVC